ncbi:MAG: DUF3253 domain-containing protein [Alphaproteobacteria bacterium]|jgi:hypothetical protein
MTDTNDADQPGAEPDAVSVDSAVHDPVAAAILDALAAAKPGGSVSPEDVARAVAESRRKANDRPDLWRRYLSAVKQQAIHLARAGEIQVLRKGQPVEDPARAKGVVRYRLPG